MSEFFDGVVNYIFNYGRKVLRSAFFQQLHFKSTEDSEAVIEHLVVVVVAVIVVDYSSHSTSAAAAATTSLWQW